jgi:hypothetical protein
VGCFLLVAGTGAGAGTWAGTTAGAGTSAGICGAGVSTLCSGAGDAIMGLSTLCSGAGVGTGGDVARFRIWAIWMYALVMGDP